MKKILSVLLLTFFILISIMTLSIYSQSSLMKKVTSNTYQINVSNWTKKETSHDINKTIEKISKQQNANIYRIYYVPQMTKNDIDIYASIGSKQAFTNLFNIKFKGENTPANLQNNLILSTNSKADNMIGHIRILNDNNINIQSLAGSSILPITGVYYVQGGNSKSIISAFKNLGLTSTLLKNDNVNSTQSSFNTNVIVASALVIILIIITYLYYLIGTLKEYAIKVVSGYSKVDIFKKYIKISLVITALCILVNIIITIIYAYFKYKVGILNFLIYYISIYVLVYIAINILLILLSLVIFRADVYSSLKNKKPLVLIAKANFIFKYLSLIIIIFVIVQLISGLMMKNKILKQMSYWQNTNKYSYTVFNFNTTNNLAEIKTSFKFKNFFEDVNSNAILCAPTYGITGVIKLNNFANPLEDTSLQDGNALYANANYLKENPIYDINNKKVKVANNFGDYLIVLVPIKYKKDINQIKASYQKNYQMEKYITKSMYQQAIGGQYALSPNDYPPVKVEIKFIRNNQKTPLYNIRKPYSVNSCIAILDGINMGADTYESLLSRGTVFVNNSYNNRLMKSAIKESGLTNNLVATPTLYSRVSAYMYKLQKELSVDLFCIAILIFTQILISIFAVVNYIERNKMIFAVKVLGGYSNFEIIKKFIFKNLIGYGIVLSINLLFYIKMHTLNIELFGITNGIVLLMLLIDSIVFYIMYKSHLKTILKSILNKE